MDRIPQELTTLIASFLERDDDPPQDGFPSPKPPASRLPPYGTISRKWQLAIESRTFDSVHIKSTELSLRAQTLIGHRRRFISTLYYHVVLPSYEDHRCAKFEIEEEMQANNKTFTDAIQALFDLLKTWEPEDTIDQPRTFALVISSIHSPMDKRYRPTEKRKQDEWNRSIGKRDDLWEHRYEHSLVRLLEHTDLPQLSIISRLEIVTQERHLEPRSAALLAVQLPQANVVKFNLFDNQSKFPNNNPSARYDFATTISKLPRPSLHEFELSYCLEDPLNHYFAPPSILLSTEPSVDHLSVALHTMSLSQNLTSLRLDPVSISPSVYGPSGLADPPSWPNLRHHFIEFQMVAPDGQWYFVRDPSAPVDDEEQEHTPDPDEPTSSDSDSDTSSYDSLVPDAYRERREAVANGNYPIREFRTLPDGPLINPLLEAMARAASHMPRLETMMLSSTMRAHGGQIFAVFYIANGVKGVSDSDPTDTNLSRMHWCVGSWRPEEVILDIWRKEKGVAKIEFFPEGEVSNEIWRFS
ncbi:MAG: hypothetical protein Q9174_001512 [Haloplaca sp. 1 TL-2023]